MKYSSLILAGAMVLALGAPSFAQRAHLSGPPSSIGEPCVTRSLLSPDLFSSKATSFINELPAQLGVITASAGSPYDAT